MLGAYLQPQFHQFAEFRTVSDGTCLRQEYQASAVYIDKANPVVRMYLQASTVNRTFMLRSGMGVT